MDYTLILKLKYPNTEWTLNGDDYDGLTWLSDSKKPTKKELDLQWDEVKTYWEDREAEQVARKNALIEKLGITAEEAALFLK